MTKFEVAFTAELGADYGIRQVIAKCWFDAIAPALICARLLLAVLATQVWNAAQFFLEVKSGQSTIRLMSDLRVELSRVTHPVGWSSY
ncbi:hypothetical protein ACI2KL_09270 [Pseudomonas yamanorum]|uniref:hypothetical protein n=1 Tax=Pseudomonas yamanorum TaxID=515393 RepID=UPI00384DDA5C